MNFSELVPTLFQILIFPLLGILTKYLVSLLTVKIKELTNKKDNVLFTKYMTMLQNTVIDCVYATNQTYVESLKKEGRFDADAQKIAFEKTLSSVMSILSHDAKEYLSESLGDLNTYVTTLIESNVATAKN